MTYVSLPSGPVARLKMRAERRLLRLFKQARNRVQHSTTRSRPKFIVGAGRSGTDLVASRLGSSFDVALFNEDNPSAFHNWRLHELTVLDRLVERVAAPVLLFKPIVETYRLPELLAHFPDSRALFMSRSPSDAINSRLRFFGEANHREVQRWIETDFAVTRTWTVPAEVVAEAKAMYGDGVSAEDAAGIHWFVYNSAYRALDLRRDDRVMIMLYEDVATNPEREFRRACEHLGIGFRSAMVESVFSSSIGHYAPPVLSRNVEHACQTLWRELLDSRNNRVGKPRAAANATSRRESSARAHGSARQVRSA